MKLSTPILCTTLLLAACGGDAKAPSDHKTGPAVSAGDEHGARKPLGKLEVGAHAFEVIQFGNIEAGHEAAFDLVFAAGVTLPGTVRAWIGVESGEGSMKAKLGKEDGTTLPTLHGHVDAPKSIPAGSKVWIEIEESGVSKRGSLASK